MENFCKVEGLPVLPVKIEETLNNNCCCLCEEGNLIQSKIVEHLKSKHGLFDELLYVDTCFCPEVVKLQKNLINHLLSHLTKVKSENNPPTTSEIFFEDYSFELEDKSEKSDDWDNVDLSNVVIKNVIYDPPLSKENFKCPDCPAVRFSLNGLQAHNSREHDPSHKFVCNMDPSNCRSRFPTKNLLKLHMKYHYVGFDNNDQLSCSVCRSSYMSRESLMKHVMRHIHEKAETHEPEILEYFECDLCGQKFQKYNVLRHMKKYHLQVEGVELHKPYAPFGPYRKRKSRKETEGKIPCHICSTYITPSSMQAHIFNMHDRVSDYKCDFEGCGKYFLHKSGLEKHKDYHLGNKRLACEFCDKKFFEAGNLRQHLLRHTNPDMFKCDICQKRFVNTRSLLLHKRSHDFDDGRRPYTCDICQKNYKYPQSLRGHMKEVHSDQPKVICSMCSFTGSKEGIRQHESRVHKIKRRSKYVFEENKLM